MELPEGSETSQCPPGVPSGWDTSAPGLELHCGYQDLSPADSSAPLSCSVTPPRVGWGRELGRVKERKAVGRNEDSSTGKAKAAQVSKAKEGIHWFTPSHWHSGVLSPAGEQGSTACHGDLA